MSKCFVTSGEAKDTVGMVQAALKSMTTGPVKVTCEPQPFYPERCQVTVPVDGGRLLVWLFARPAEQAGHIVKGKTNGSYVQVLVDTDRSA